MWDDDTWMDELTCWERLEGEEFGRMAFHLVDEVHIVPINYVARKPQLIFRTTAGSKLLAVEMNADMAFEIDRVDDEAGHAWSVVARGRAQILEGACRPRCRCAGPATVARYRGQAPVPRPHGRECDGSAVRPVACAGLS